MIEGLYAAKGYQYAKVDIEEAPMPGGPKLLHVTFKIDEGPKVQVQQIVWDGNKAFSDGDLSGQMKDTKAHGWLSWLLGGGTYDESKFDDDAERVRQYLGDRGYARVVIGTPQLEVIDTTKDGKTRHIRLRIPIDEGEKYKIGKIEISGNKAIRTEYLQSVFDIKPGDTFSHKKIADGYQKAKDAYGANGYMDFTMLPDLSFPGIDPETGRPIGPKPPSPILDLNLRMTEGPQYFVNHIAFVGNTNTHDMVVRREMRVLEGGVFNAESLKESVRRINQLGYFKPIDEKTIDQDVAKTPGADNKVDITLKVEEQNRNQISFGAGVSQFEGFFGQLSFQTSNFLGRGETVGVTAEKGSQAKDYEASFSEPYLFDRPISAGVSVYKREYIYPLEFTQDSTGSTYTLGFPIRSYTRGFLSYSYEDVLVKDINSAYLTPQVLARSPYLAASLLVDQGGRQRVGKISPSLVYNTVNQPIFPTDGKRFTVGFDFAGIGGNTEYVATNLEAIWYHTLTSRTSLGLHAQVQYIRPFGSTHTLPILEKYFLGGEYSVRGFDIRSIGPRDPSSELVTGGNKTLLFNAEYMINVYGPVRLIAFYDAGQVKDVGQGFSWREPLTRNTIPVYVSPILFDPLAGISLNNPLVSYTPITQVIGHTSAFKTSTGLEVRFMMPVLNVPFRLIGAYNPQRGGVLDNNLLPQQKLTFRFAVGSTF